MTSITPNWDNVSLGLTTTLVDPQQPNFDQWFVKLNNHTNGEHLTMCLWLAKGDKPATEGILKLLEGDLHSAEKTDRIDAQFKLKRLFRGTGVSLTEFQAALI